MVSPVNALAYKNIVSSFFADNKFISKRKDRIENGVGFVLNTVPVQNLSQKLQDGIRHKVVCLEMTFMRKWKVCKPQSKENFELQNEKWLHLDLKVNNPIFPS